MTSPTVAAQPGLDDLGTPLREVTFCVVDLETTGTSTTDAITEIGAVKVRGDQTLGEFATLINPCMHIPARIQALTGITDRMVAYSPTLPAVLPTFLQFVTPCVLVTHNARFDVGFLRRACAELGYEWPGMMVVDTVGLARKVLLRDEVPNVKLHTLAAHFRTTVTPGHRALSDARATVNVLHELLGRAGGLGVTTLEDLKEIEHRVPAKRRAKSSWTSELPTEPGVYAFYAQRPGQSRQILYVGKSVNVARRVRSYFTASENRTYIDEMVRVATGVEATVCATDLEAEVRELRMIAAHSPHYNRRSKHQDRLCWVKLTTETWPRLSITYAVDDDQARYLGPFSSRVTAKEVCQVIHDAYPIRQCTQSMGPRASPTGCVLAELGRCLAPCLPDADHAAHQKLVSGIKQAWNHDVRPLLGIVGSHLRLLVAEQRYEQAAQITSRLELLTAAIRRWHRLVAVGRCPQIVAVRRSTVPSRPGWQINIIRHGRLAAAGFARAGSSVRQVAAHVLATAETVLPSPHDLPSASVEEAERVIAFLTSPGVRLLEIDGEWSMPLGAGIGEQDLPRWTLSPLPVAPPGDLNEVLPGSLPDAGQQEISTSIRRPRPS